MRVFILLFFCFSFVISAENFMKEMGPMLKEFRKIKTENNGNTKGKLKGLLAKLDKIAPKKDAQEYEIYLSAKGELLMANGDYEEAAKTLKKTKAASINYNWGIWKKIIESIFHSKGEKAAKAEYDKVVKKIGDKPLGRDFKELVGEHLDNLSK